MYVKRFQCCHRVIVLCASILTAASSAEAPNPARSTVTQQRAVNYFQACSSCRICSSRIRSTFVDNDI